jgi:DNA-binding protein HU-beta
MNKGELVDYLAEDLEVPKALADRFVNSFVEAVYSNVRKEGLKLAGFGTFGSVKRKARIGRNPQTGEEIKIPSRWVPTFKAGSVLKESVEKKKR